MEFKLGKESFTQATVHNSDKYRCLRLFFLTVEEVKVHMACFIGPIVMTRIHFQAEDVTPNKLTSMAVDIASGLAYLAEMKFVHRYVQCLFYFPTTAWDEDCLLH